ncbi:HTH-type transcriptional regulator PerR [Rhodovastum atsumiense]|uniref:LysR family transcriptional regulator n=1 Tax=Rhodovastum atsumiense TaxID=504468 RepID=A0A5M6J185_9PROT|nr:LysR family transcriptional regulator [Rhodovastum atsumiense]KAA5614353.1 LysR family transcriptional regulator [Rhodovastum atsumiense]CAH2604822.1 HTH-type transcriptional regulator PerR [Rhodovastum atsumiense]
MQHLPLTALRAFEAAARTGSFRAAADALGVTPSAVSHAIRGLEASLKTTLFFREGRQIALTGQGEALLRHVRQGFDELKRGIAAVSGRNRMLLRLHSAPSFAAQWLVPRLPRLLADTEGLDLRIAASVSYSRFLNDEFDVDIVYGTAWAEQYARSRHPRIVVLPLGEEVVTPLCAPALAGRIHEPRDLFAQTLIESDNKQVRWSAWFAANGLAAPEPRGPRFDRSFLSISAAADGLGVALESTRLAERELASGRLVRPLPRAEDVTYVGHFLTFPRAERYRLELLVLTGWLATELGITLDLQARPAGV